jgi:hypothetical protein
MNLSLKAVILTHQGILILGLATAATLLVIWSGFAAADPRTLWITTPRTLLLAIHASAVLLPVGDIRRVLTPSPATTVASPAIKLLPGPETLNKRVQSCFFARAKMLIRAVIVLLLLLRCAAKCRAEGVFVAAR